VICQSDKVSAVLRQGSNISGMSKLKSKGDDETSQPDDPVTPIRVASRLGDPMDSTESDSGTELVDCRDGDSDGEEDTSSTRSLGEEDHGIRFESDAEDDGDDAESERRARSALRPQPHKLKLFCSSSHGDGNWGDVAEGDFIRCWVGQVAIVSSQV